MIDTIGRSGNGGVITSSPDKYSYPIYFVDASTPRWDVPCTWYSCAILTDGGTKLTRVDTLTGVPIPANAQPSSGSDGQMIIIDRETGTEYDLWQVKRKGRGWSVSNATIYNMFWDGMPTEYNSRGAGVPYLAGLIRPWEIRQGRIEHAIAFAYPHSARERCVFPASKTDGQSKLPYAIPEGARLQLDPALTEADFDRMGLSRTGKIIARALQEYGMINIDVSGRPKIMAENLEDNPLATEQWTNSALNLTDTTIAAIPYTAYRVLALPESYWKPGGQGAMHGACHAFEEDAVLGPTSAAPGESTAWPKAITFEDGSLAHPTSGADHVEGTVRLKSSDAPMGRYAARIPNAGEAYLQEDFPAAEELYLSFHLHLNALPKEGVRIVLLSSDNKSMGNLVLRPDGVLQLRFAGKSIGADSLPLQVDTVYRIGLRQKQGTGGDAILEAYLAEGDTAFGEPFAATTTGGWTMAADRLRIGATTGVALHAVLDDIKLDSATMPP